MTQTAVSPGTLTAPLSPVLRRVLAVAVGSLLLAVSAHISLPLFFTPVPLTLQTFAVLLLALLLEPGVAAATMVAYLAEGAAGLPVFNPHGPGGILQLMGPTGGYLLSYPFAAALVSFVSRRMRNLLFTGNLIAAALGGAVYFTAGALWFAVLMHQTLSFALRMTVWPFLAGDALKVAAAAAIATGYFRLRDKSREPAARTAA
jgi:biotin transport system substrate-specific component